MLPLQKFKPQNPWLPYDGLGQRPWSPMLDFRATLEVLSTCLECFRIFEVNGACSSIWLFKMDCSMRDGLWWICILEIACFVDAWRQLIVGSVYFLGRWRSFAWMVDALHDGHMEDLLDGRLPYKQFPINNVEYCALWRRASSPRWHAC